VNPIDAIYILAAGLAAPFWARKPREGWSQRMGHVAEMLDGSEASAPNPDRPRILLHAVSVGEVNALRPLVPLLAPHADVIVCTTTDTGLARARQLFSESAQVVRYPLDFSWAVRRFLDHVQPSVVGLVELELWPNFLGECGRRRVPACVINGRLSERSFKGYDRWTRVVRPLMFSRIAHAAVQEEAYADRFTALGTPSVSVTGSMKWDSITASGRGTLHTYTVIHHPQFPGYDFPIIAALVDLEEGTRLMSSVVECKPADLQIGMALQGFIHEDEDGFRLPVFRPAS